MVEHEVKAVGGRKIMNVFERYLSLWVALCDLRGFAVVK